MITKITLHSILFLAFLAVADSSVPDAIASEDDAIEKNRPSLADQANNEDALSFPQEDTTEDAEEPDSTPKQDSPLPSVLEEITAPVQAAPMQAAPMQAAPMQREDPVVITESELLLVPEEQLQSPLNLLGSTVVAGESALLKWAFEATFADTSTPVPVLVVNGVKPGPTLCLTAAVHGDELNGIEVVRRIVHEIDPSKLSGAVIGVPIVNLQGFRRASRYLPDRRDLNRFFPGREQGSYASRIAHSFFHNVIIHCNYLIDLHTGSLSRTNLPQIRANLLVPEVASMAEKMGSIVVLQSKGSVGTLRRAAVEAGIPAVTLEAGAPNNLQKEAVEQGVKSVLSVMGPLGLSAPKPFWKRSQEPVFYQSTWIRARQGGILFSKIELGDSVKKDTVLGLLSDPISNKTTEIVAPFEGRVIGMALNQVMYPGFAAYHIGLKSSVVEAAQPTQALMEEETVDGSSIVESEGNTQISNPEVIIDAERATPEDAITEPEKSPIEDMELPTIDSQ